MPFLIIRRVKVSLELFRMSVTALINFANAVFTSMTGNAFFTTPSPALLAIQTAITDLENAAAAAATGGPETTAIMLEKREVLMNLLTAEGHYVEDIANDPANVANAEVIILSAGMHVKNFSPRQKQVFTVSAGLFSGTVDMTAPAVKRGTHEWEYSLTPVSSNSWVELSPTTKAHTVISGLTSGTVVNGRHRAVLKTGPTDWDDMQTVVVP